ncbi:MAG: cell division protein FtsZ [Saprospiraceae bacterium]|nr:cell division protein FtsZ [Saprospiraceae bacterium]
MLFDLPQEDKAIIKVIGVGGGGSNAVSHMYRQGIVGVDFAVCNTDNQAMEMSPVPMRIQLGPQLTSGRGAGSRPQIGKQACIESIDDVRTFLEDGTKMLFVTAGMGGGTGTGAAPIIAKAAREMDILTVGIVTLPFTFEGRRRTRHALEGLEELKGNVDAIIVISNDKLREIHGNLAMSDAFAEADNILTTAAKGIAEIITVAGHVNVDFEDVNTVMRDSGVAIMGTAVFAGDGRAQKAVTKALNSPLLEDSDIRGAQHILLNISSGSKEVTMDEISEITEYVQEEAGYGTDLIWGHCHDESLGDNISVTIIATGFEQGKNERRQPDSRKVVVPLEEPKETMKDMFAVGLAQGDESNTVEFDDVRAVANLSASRYSYEDPYIKSDEKEQLEAARKKRQAMEEMRREKLRSYHYVNPNKLNNAETITSLTNEPAYLRRDVELDDVPHSSEVQRSRWTLNDDEEPQLREDNSFLHDNAD